MGDALMINEWNQLSFINEQFSVADRRIETAREGENEYSTPHYILQPWPAARLTSSVNNLDFDSATDSDRFSIRSARFWVSGYCAPILTLNWTPLQCATPSLCRASGQH